MNFSNWRSVLGQAASQAVQTASSTARDLQAQIAGAKVLRDYNLQGSTIQIGPGGLWRLTTARSRKEGTSLNTSFLCQCPVASQDNSILQGSRYPRACSHKQPACLLLLYLPAYHTHSQAACFQHSHRPCWHRTCIPWRLPPVTWCYRGAA